jgi:hypothetical protein
LLDNSFMNQFSFSATGFGGVLGALAASHWAARLCTLALAAALTGLATSAVLKVQYGAPAPAVAPAQGLPLAANAAPTPAWLAGGQASASSAAGDLKLIGVVAQGANGYALVQDTQDSAKRPQIWRVGQRQANGNVLTAVQGKSATFNLNGEARTLTLDGQAGAGGSPATAIHATLGGAAPALYAPTPMPPAAMMQPALNAADATQTAQQLQQIQQLQQAAANESGAQPIGSPEQPATAVKKRLLGGRP